MTIRWMTAGCLFVTAAFFIPGHSTELWPEIRLAGIVLVLYLAALLGWSTRNSATPSKARKVLLFAGIAALVAGMLTAGMAERQSLQRRHDLRTVAGTIGRGIYAAMLPDSLLAVLESYHRVKRTRATTIGEQYRLRYPPGKPGDRWSTLAMTGMEDPPDDVFLTEISDTHAVLVARHPWYPGRDPAFASYSGPSGVVQVRLTLTKRGIRYDTDN